MFNKLRGHLLYNKPQIAPRVVKYVCSIDHIWFSVKIFFEFESAKTHTQTFFPADMAGKKCLSGHLLVWHMA